MIKRKILGLAAVVVCLAGVGSAGEPSQNIAPSPQPEPSGLQSMDDAWWTGPLLAPNPAALHQGGFDIEPYLIDSIGYGSYDDNWRFHGTNDHENSYQSVILMKYGLSDNFTFWVLPSFGYNALNYAKNSSGLQLGDTTVKLQYMLTKWHEGSWMPTLSFILGEDFPTGRYDNLGSRPADGLGSGAFGTFLALYMGENFWLPTGRILRARLDLTYTFMQENINVDQVSVYGTDQNFHGHASPGNSFAADLGLEYSLTRNWVPALDIVYAHGDDTSVHGYEVQRLSSGLSAIPYNSHSGSNESFSVAPALEYNFNKHWGVIVGAQLSFAGRNSGAFVAPQIAVNINY
jgi:hypothetical protein